MTKKTMPTILIFRIGQLGDTLIAMPAIEAIRSKYPSHHLILLTDRHPGKAGYVSSWDILGPTGWFDQVIFYDPGVRGRDKLKMLGRLVSELRDLKVEHLFNLAPGRSRLASARDKWFFHFVVAPNLYSACPPFNPPITVNGTLPRLTPEWRSLLQVVFNFGAPINDQFTLPIPEREREIANTLAQSERIDFSSKLIAIGPGSKMAAKKWPKEYFSALGVRLLDSFPDVHLVVLGGKEDALLGNELCEFWGERSTNLAGELSIYGSAALLERCAAYVGNDTGTMHLAAMVGVPCVALFSARDYPGKWDPYGKQHIVLRHVVACEGCMLEICKFDNECLKQIATDKAFDATKAVLNK
jgi:heptosyltransferase III